MSLRTDTVAVELIEVLRELMAADHLGTFFLGGGTSLALRLGHRRSIGIDLFSSEAFDAASLAENLEFDHGMVGIDVSGNSVSGRIRAVKVDLLAHRYPLIEAGETIDGLRFCSLADTAAMKLNAINNRGAKKDFWDIAALLERYSIAELFDLFERKYRNTNAWTLRRSLLYFDDANSEPDPIDLSGRTWESVKSELKEALRF